MKLVCDACGGAMGSSRRCGACRDFRKAHDLGFVDPPPRPDVHVPLDLAEAAELLPEQLATGLSEARRIITESVGFRFAGEVFPFAFKQLALRAINELAKRAGI